MTVTAHQLLTRAAARFRSYEANHRNKADRHAAADETDETRSLIDDATKKANVNASAALEIELFLRENPDVETVRSSDVIGDQLIRGLMNAAWEGLEEMEGLRRDISHLKPKAEAYDTIALIARLTAPKEGGFARVDAAWQLKEAIERIRDRQIARDAAKVAS